MRYLGSCHCGRIKFEIKKEIDQVIQCNCSICTMRGYLLWFVSRYEVILKTPESNMSTYTFNKHQIKHRFCPVCGVGPFGEGKDPKTGEEMAAVNVRCLEGVDFSKLKTIPFDGRSL